MDGEHRVSVDLGTFLQDQQAGLVQIVKINGQPFYSRRAFDPKSGKPMPLNVALEREAIAAVVDDLTAKIAAAREVLAQIDAAREVLGE